MQERERVVPSGSSYRSSLGASVREKHVSIKEAVDKNIKLKPNFFISQRPGGNTD
jgi:hypothetical protein